MIYLVTMELEGAPPVRSTQEMVEWLEQRIIPSEETMIKLQAEKKILAGGDISGRRGMVFILESASNEELSKLLGTIPEWPFLKVDVTPLESFGERLDQVRETLERIKETIK